MKIKYYWALLVCALTLPFQSCDKNPELLSVEESADDLAFKDLAQVWDEGSPMGNGEIGALVWQKDGKLRIALDRTDLWDVRPLPVYQGEQFTFKWVYDHVMQNDYKPVQDWYNLGKYSGPTKIPGAALELDMSEMGKVVDNHLYLDQALNEITWDKGIVLQQFVHATQPVGMFLLSNVNKDFDFDLNLVPPVYEKSDVQKEHISMTDICSLGYKKGEVIRKGNEIYYKQNGWGDFNYEVAVKWEKIADKIVGAWSITSSRSQQNAKELVANALEKGINACYDSHLQWWNSFYGKSSISVPDEVLTKQYHNELYKMGCIARNNSYPISLQAVWTADNGEMAPWKGDFHHDLNTQLSYWPFYTSNHLDETLGYTSTLWNQHEYHKEYTKKYFGTNGLNVPGVCDLDGKPMGGWVQYSLGPTVSAWLAQHFYLYWTYSQDRDYLKNYAYPYSKEVATYLEEFTVMKNGVRTLPLSSSPEFNDNRIDAWYHEMSNFDRALIKFNFKSTAEMAEELGLADEASHWKKLLAELPDFDYDEKGVLSIAPGYTYNQSHRHFSHMIGIHPLGILDASHGEKDQKIIQANIDNVDKHGPSAWCGYTYTWLACMKARNFDGDGACQALRDFSTNFCLKNTFHVNGDQKGGQKSGLTYRPFTLEGNMAFAAGVQEMLLQSHTGVISVFPAIPSKWENASFKDLRAVGAFLVSADYTKTEGITVSCYSEKGGKLRLQIPEGMKYVSAEDSNSIQRENSILSVDTQKGETVKFLFK